MYTPNGVSFEEIEKVAQMGVQINIDNLSILEHFGTKYPTVPVCIRVNPHVMAGGNANISVGHIDSKFGISIHQMPHILRIVENTKMHINGIHMHTGSDILDVEVFLYAAEILFESAKQFKTLDFIDFGSGFKVPYKKGDIETDIEEFGRKLSKRFLAFEKEYGRNLTLVFEPGKFLVSEADQFLAKVNVVKQTTSTVFAGVDTGFNHLIRPMLYGAEHHIENISNIKGKERYYSVVGYICETDTFATNRRISEIHEGDILNLKMLERIVFLWLLIIIQEQNLQKFYGETEQLMLIRERETFEDILRNQVEIDINYSIHYH